jgi:plastocyanin
MSSTPSVAKPSLVSYWLLGRSELGSNTWLENLVLGAEMAAPPASSKSRTDGAGSRPATTVDISVGPFNQTIFQPSVVTINVGDTVRWTFGSVGHDIVSGSSCIPNNGFCWPNNANCGNNGSANSGTVYSHTFNTAGSFPYFCGPHCFNGMTGTVIVQGGPTPTPTPTPTAGTIQLSASSYIAGEGDGHVDITVTRAGDSSAAASVAFATSDQASAQNCNVKNGFASSRCDYEAGFTNVMFAPGETSKIISVFIIDDAYQEGPETFTVSLSNPSNASLGSPSSAAVTINDNDSADGSNPLDLTRFFVKQQYFDFLNREPDQAGWDFWSNNIDNCGANPSCVEVQRINTSASFFLSIEFQNTGYLVERIWKTAFGDATGSSTFPSPHQLSVPGVRFNQFIADTKQIGQGVIVLTPGWEEKLESNKQAFTLDFVQRAQFISAFSTAQTPAQFVDKLFSNAGVTPSAGDRNAAIAEFGSATDTSDVAARSRALRDVAENSILQQQEFNRAFVLMQYYGYLRRNPDDPQDSDYSGYDFWLTKLNQFGGNYINAEMVKAFVSSIEYRQRFGP